jgi:hypothetical protein
VNMKRRLSRDQKRKKKVAEKERRRLKKPIPLSVCVDCGQPCYAHEEYMVRSKTWAEAGMSWEGRLHRACLEKRLGRELRQDELLVQPLRWNEDGSVSWLYHPDYKDSPEFLETVKRRS